MEEVMATTTEAPARPTLFLRNATGLVKAWSTFDAFLYAFWSVNLVTLGLYGMSFVYTIPDGQLLGAVLLTGVLVTFLVLTYAQLVSVMPRAGGDYAWQSRILGGGVGFVLAITGWWFTLWLWTPIYANILIVQFFAPLAYTLGWTSVATFFAFYLLWPVWGATLYGEVRGAKEYRKVFNAMFWGLWVTVALVAVIILLIVKTIGWDFYYAANAAYWNSIFVAGSPAPPVSIWPYPVMLAGWLVGNHLFQALLIAVMGLWFFGWAGTLFLSSTRVIFAAAFDRVLPEWAANISAKRRVPYGSLILMIVPSLVISALWAYGGTGLQGIFLWATGVIAITFLGTVVAAAILPWRRKDIFENSPISRFRIAGIPVITITGVVSAIFLLFMLAEWSFNDVYGTSFKINGASPKYFLATYLVAIAIYVVARVVRKRQGIDLSRIHREIPVE